MSQHKKQAKPELKPEVIQSIEDRGLPSLTLQESIYPTLSNFLKAIYRDGANGTTRSLAKDVQTITDLLEGKG